MSEVMLFFVVAISFTKFIFFKVTGTDKDLSQLAKNLSIFNIPDFETRGHKGTGCATLPEWFFFTGETCGRAW
jgi:hypothetical protein